MNCNKTPAAYPPIWLDLAEEDPARASLGDYPQSQQARWWLARNSDNQLQLGDNRNPRQRGLVADFAAPEIRRRIAAGRRQPLGRACGLKPGRPATIVDATLGLGRDAATLAGLSAKVVGYERHPLLHALLSDAWARAPTNIRNNLEIRLGDGLAVAWESFDAVYLDPMFPDAGRRAAPGLAMQVLKALVGDDADNPERLVGRLASPPCRIVLKRPPRGARVRLADPDLVFGGGRAAYAVYLPKASNDSLNR